mmetsp:Transcript_50458/g.97442  ORF Transcript_50458/g.97442 Transcript_50458/m.97442 type:complete len:203 (+) Transcript_50458:56-664(+)
MPGTLSGMREFGYVQSNMVPSIDLPMDPSAMDNRLANRAGLTVTDLMMGRRPGTMQQARKAPWEASSSRVSYKRQRMMPDFRLPSWVAPDAHLVYRSRTLGKNVECVVEMVDRVRCEVEVSFVMEPQGRKIIPFGVLASADNPLLGPLRLAEEVEDEEEKKDTGKEKEEEKVEQEAEEEGEKKDTGKKKEEEKVEQADKQES